jgi:hypothetical protein
MTTIDAEPAPAGVENASMSSAVTRLRAALVRRPHFDEVGALQATRLGVREAQQAGRRL